jgi:Ras family protein T1
MKEHLSVLVLGDSMVGKSSLISSYISRHFPREVPAVMINTIIPPEATTNDVCVTIMDSSAKAGDRDILKQKIFMADSIIALYDVSRPETLDSISAEWLPLIKEVCRQQQGQNSSNNATNTITQQQQQQNYKPVILIGNKTDLLAEDECDIDKLHALLSAFPFVLLSSTCSAVKLQDVDDAFYFAEMVVTFPLNPLFDVISQEFTPVCRYYDGSDGCNGIYTVLHYILLSIMLLSVLTRSDCFV